MILKEATLVGVLVSGIEPGSLVLSAVATLCGAILAHAEAASTNCAFVKEAGRRADAAHRLMKSLAGAIFPDDHPSLARVVHVLNDLEERARKWRESSKLSQRFALTRAGITKACKYRESFQQLFALLDHALQELMSAVQVKSFSNITELRSDFRKETEKLNREFATAAAAAGEHAASQEEVLQALGNQNASFEDLLAASRAQAEALAEMESRLVNTLDSLKADLAAGREAAQAAAKAAAAAAEAMQEHESNSGGGRGAADNTDEIVAALKANILNHIVPELLDALVREGNLTRAAVTEAKDAVIGEVRGLENTVQENHKSLQGTMQENHNEIAVLLEALKRSAGEEMARIYVYSPYNSDDGHSGALLGRGAFGFTYLMKNMNDKHFYAVKLIDINWSELEIIQLRKESEVLAHLDHPNIVRYHGCFFYGKNDKYWAIAMAHLSGGSLLAKMKASPKPTPEQSLRWVLEIASALAHMHENSVQHRDMKPDNVLFASEAPDARAVVIDLGLASFDLAKSTASSAVGALLYRSPEKALGERYGPSDDLWGLGLITGGLAQGQSLEARVKARGGSGGLFALNQPRVKEFVAEAIASCASLGNLAAALLIEDPKLRPTAAAVVASKGNVAALARPSVGVEAIIEEEEEDEGEDEAGGGNKKSEQEASSAREAEAEMQRMLEVATSPHLPLSFCSICASDECFKLLPTVLGLHVR